MCALDGRDGYLTRRTGSAIRGLAASSTLPRIKYASSPSNAHMRLRTLEICLTATLAFGRHDASAQSALSGERINIARATGKIVIDGDLSDEGWRGATRGEKWYEINPGDNTEPKVRNVGYLAYDDRFVYAGFQFADPTPGRIRAPLGDRDNVSGFTDYGGIILDTRNDGRSA